MDTYALISLIRLKHWFFFFAFFTRYIMKKLKNNYGGSYMFKELICKGLTAVGNGIAYACKHPFKTIFTIAVCYVIIAAVL